MIVVADEQGSTAFEVPVDETRMTDLTLRQVGRLCGSSNRPRCGGRIHQLSARLLKAARNDGSTDGVRCGCAPCQGGALQWVQIPPGKRSSRKHRSSYGGNEMAEAFG